MTLHKNECAKVFSYPRYNKLQPYGFDFRRLKWWRDIGEVLGRGPGSTRAESVGFCIVSGTITMEDSYCCSQDGRGTRMGVSSKY